MVLSQPALKPFTAVGATMPDGLLHSYPLGGGEVIDGRILASSSVVPLPRTNLIGICLMPFCNTVRNFLGVCLPVGSGGVLLFLRELRVSTLSILFELFLMCGVIGSLIFSFSFRGFQTSSTLRSRLPKQISFSVKGSELVLPSFYFVGVCFSPRFLTGTDFLGVSEPIPTLCGFLRLAACHTGRVAHA